MDTNISERVIINDIISLNTKFVDFLDYVKNEIELINNKINKLDNHFFTNNQKIVDSMHTLYNYNDINQIINNINKNTTDLDDILNNCCEKHDFINDYIDTTFGNNIKITYCQTCNVSKNF